MLRICGIRDGKLLIAGAGNFACRRSGYVVGGLLLCWLGKLGILGFETPDIFILKGVCDFYWSIIL